VGRSLRDLHARMLALSLVAIENLRADHRKAQGEAGIPNQVGAGRVECLGFALPHRLRHTGFRMLPHPGVARR
jgi:hypothetical protein